MRRRIETSARENPEAVARTRTIGLANERLILNHLLEHGSSTRTDLRKASGLSQPTVSAILERLSSRELVSTDGFADVQGARGPSAELFKINSHRAFVAVLRLRLATVSIGIFNLAGELVASTETQLTTPSQPAPELAVLLKGLAESSQLDESHLVRTVVGVPGPVDPHTREAVRVDGRPTWGMRLKGELEQAIGRPLWLENQLNLACVAEHRRGAGRGRSSLCLLSGKPAAGLALILGNNLWTGASGRAGEVAALPMPGISHGALGEALESSTGEVQMADALAHAATAVVAVVDPGLIVLTGRVLDTDGEQLLQAVQARYSELSPWPVEFAISTVHGDPVLLGGSLIALQEIRDELWGTTFRSL